MNEKQIKAERKYQKELSGKIYCENPKVTVIVPVYKVDKYLNQCLNSIVNQTLKELEIIIVDEGDKDRCREIIDYYERTDARVVAPHQKNGGYGASCNLGIEMARGEYLAIVESDDYIEPDMYEAMYYYAKALNADVVKTPYTEFFANGEKHDCRYREQLAASCPKNMCFSVKEFGDLLSVHASLWSGLYKTSYMKQKNIRFVTAKGGAYVDVGFRIDTLVNTDKVAWLDKPGYNYRVDSEGSTTNNFKIGPMLQRWKEVHEKFSAQGMDEYNLHYGKSLIVDEYLNTLGWLSLIDITKEELEQMKDNFAYIKEDTIKNTTVLNERQKKEMLDFKRHPQRFYRRMKERRVARKCRDRMLPFVHLGSNFILQKWLVQGLVASSLAAMMLPQDSVKRRRISVVSLLFFVGVCVNMGLKLVYGVVRRMPMPAFTDGGSGI